MNVLHLPNSLTRAEKAQPEAIRVERSIQPGEAMQMIAMQQGKIVRLLMALSEVENRMHAAQDRSSRAVHIAAKQAGIAKKAEEGYVSILRQFAEERERANQQADQLTKLARVVVRLMDTIAWLQPVPCARMLFDKEAFEYDGRDVSVNETDDGMMTVELVRSDAPDILAELKPCSQF